MNACTHECVRNMNYRIAMDCVDHYISIIIKYIYIYKKHQLQCKYINAYN